MQNKDNKPSTPFKVDAPSFIPTKSNINAPPPKKSITITKPTRTNKFKSYKKFNKPKLFEKSKKKINTFILEKLNIKNEKVNSETFYKILKMLNDRYIKGPLILIEIYLDIVTYDIDFYKKWYATNIDFFKNISEVDYIHFFNVKDINIRYLICSSFLDIKNEKKSDNQEKFNNTFLCKLSFNIYDQKLNDEHYENQIKNILRVYTINIPEDYEPFMVEIDKQQVFKAETETEINININHNWIIIYENICYYIYTKFNLNLDESIDYDIMIPFYYTEENDITIENYMDFLLGFCGEISSIRSIINLEIEFNSVKYRKDGNYVIDISPNKFILKNYLYLSDIFVDFDENENKIYGMLFPEEFKEKYDEAKRLLINDFNSFKIYKYKKLLWFKNYDKYLYYFNRIYNIDDFNRMEGFDKQNCLEYVLSNLNFDEYDPIVKFIDLLINSSVVANDFLNKSTNDKLYKIYEFISKSKSIRSLYNYIKPEPFFEMCKEMCGYKLNYNNIINGKLKYSEDNIKIIKELKQEVNKEADNIYYYLIDDFHFNFYAQNEAEKIIFDRLKILIPDENGDEYYEKFRIFYEIFYDKTNISYTNYFKNKIAEYRDNLEKLLKFKTINLDQYKIPEFLKNKYNELDGNSKDKFKEILKNKIPKMIDIKSDLNNDISFQHIKFLDLYYHNISCAKLSNIIKDKTRKTYKDYILLSGVYYKNNISNEYKIIKKINNNILDDYAYFNYVFAKKRIVELDEKYNEILINKNSSFKSFEIKKNKNTYVNTYHYFYNKEHIINFCKVNKLKVYGMVVTNDKEFDFKAPVGYFFEENKKLSFDNNSIFFIYDNNKFIISKLWKLGIPCTYDINTYHNILNYGIKTSRTIHLCESKYGKPRFLYERYISNNLEKAKNFLDKNKINYKICKKWDNNGIDCKYSNIKVIITLCTDKNNICDKNTFDRLGKNNIILSFEHKILYTYIRYIKKFLEKFTNNRIGICESITVKTFRYYFNFNDNKYFTNNQRVNLIKKQDFSEQNYEVGNFIKPPRIGLPYLIQLEQNEIEILKKKWKHFINNIFADEIIISYELSSVLLAAGILTQCDDALNYAIYDNHKICINYFLELHLANLIKYKFD